MATIIIGSARSDENGKYSGGKAGDQKQTSGTNDTKGEVSMQTMYKHTKGWLVFRPKSVSVATQSASEMKNACNNAHIGYDQGQRTSLWNYAVKKTIKSLANVSSDVEVDCSELIRTVIYIVTGKDIGDITTANEATALKKSGLFEESFEYVSQEKTPVYNGDVLVTKTKGHTAIVVSGNQRKANATSSEKCPYQEPEVVLKKGSKGSGVKWLQWYLNKLLAKEIITAKSSGKTVTKLEVDGEWGDLTEVVFRAFQKKYPATGTNNAPDGKCGPASRSKLKSLVK
jgi:hypothetical protein